MKVTICDVKNCGKVIEGNAEPADWTRTWDDGKITISLTNEIDRCDDCIRKTNAKLAKAAWDLEKRPSTKKEKT